MWVQFGDPSPDAHGSRASPAGRVSGLG